MKTRISFFKKGALLAIAMFLVVGIAAIVPFLIQSAESAGERTKYSDEWTKIQWAVSGIKNKHISKGVNSDFYNPYGNSTIATISYGDFHVSVNVSERKTMLDRNSCFSVIPSVYRGASQPYADGGYDLSDYAVTSNSAPGVAAGANHSFAWKKDGTLYSWGYNNMGQLGLGNTTGFSSPQIVKQGDLKAPESINYFNQGWLVAGGSEVSAAVSYSGVLYGWGKSGEVPNLFTITPIENNTPAYLGFANEVLDMAAGNGFLALLAKDGKIYRRSFNDSLGQTGEKFSMVPGISGVKGIAGGTNHILAITSNGDLWGYGSNAAYQLGRSDTSINSAVKINDSEVGLVSQVQLENSNKRTPSVDSKFYISSAYNLATFTVTANAAPRDDPIPPYFTLGEYYKDYIFLDSDNNANDKLLFVNTSTNLGGGKYLWEYAQDTSVEAGTYTVRLYTERTRMLKIFGVEFKDVDNKSINPSWYKNNTGGSSDFGKGVYSFYGSLASITGFIGVAAGGDFSLALKKDDDKTVLYSWGTNTYGQLGLGNYDTAQTMAKVPDFPPNSEKLRSVSAGAVHALVLTESGKVYAWGRNNYGQLGIGNTTNKNVPTLITALNGKKIISIAAGDNHSLAMDDAFNVYSWGRNNYGQLGLGNITNRNTPIPVSGF